MYVNYQKQLRLITIISLKRSIIILEVSSFLGVPGRPFAPKWADVVRVTIKVCQTKFLYPDLVPFFPMAFFAKCMQKYEIILLINRVIVISKRNLFNRDVYRVLSGSYFCLFVTQVKILI